MTKSKGPKIVYVCQQCGAQQPKWMGKCPDCGEWNSLVEEKGVSARPATSPRGGLFRMREVAPLAYQEIESQDDSRQSSGIEEFDRVLGGGIVPGSLVLIGGDPGIGKSTLLLEVADKLSNNYGSVLYISGEESERQIKLRGERLGINPEGLYLLPETCLERIFEQIDRLDPKAVIVDSVQTVFSMKLESAPGSVSQVREVAGQFLILAKNRTVPVFLIGHVTKEGAIAGPKALEHIVDTVLY
ncbi:MAG TPA: DNA repair protein RadA, partial [Blastocatellia bacterium]|nr:DNA repair protein RadA [Blastocatellia bacterium]